MYSYKYPRPAVTVDIAIFMPTGKNYQILLIKRASEPYLGCYALPGGFCEIDESLEQAAIRELQEETGLRDIPLTQIHTFSNPDRDPRGRIISTCFAGLLIKPHQGQIKAGSDAADLGWFMLDDLPRLAFDHQQIIHKAAGSFLSL
ncbi:MAG: NUDIX domain-containing protein [Anaerolineales bacterium]